jgi:transposase
VLECQVENYLKDRQHSILWTPPYSPDLQPIELFWAAGKNHSRNFSSSKTTMRETVFNVREGWYGNCVKWDSNETSLLTDYRRQRKEAVSCHRLFKHVVAMADSKFLPLCEGISGKIGQLIVDNEYRPIKTDLPIDLLMNNLSKINPVDVVEIDDNDEQ